MQSLLSDESLIYLANEHAPNLFQRIRKFTQSNFFELIFFNKGFDFAEMSLQDIVIEFHKHTGQTLSKQGLNKRFNPQAVLFLKEILRRVIQEKISQYKLIDNYCFKGVLIKDATSFQLPECMQMSYKGSGGSGSEACIKIQFEYDAFTGEITSLELHPYIATDQKTSKEDVDKLKKGYLYLRDLGYMTIDFINGIKKKEAFYLGRLNTKYRVYVENNKNKGKNSYNEVNEKSTFRKLCFKSIHKLMKIKKLNRLELLVCITKEYEKTRLIIEMLPDEVVEKRLRDKRREAKKKGRKISKESIVRASLNLYITNASVEQYPIEHVRKIYQIRWQIELIFKAFKSKMNIDKIKRNMKTERFECALIVRLIYIVMHFKIYHFINNLLWQTKRQLISIYKFYALCKIYIDEFVEAFRNGRIENYFEKIINLANNILKEKRKYRDNLEDVILRVITNNCNTNG